MLSWITLPEATAHAVEKRQSRFLPAILFFFASTLCVCAAVHAVPAVQVEATDDQAYETGTNTATVRITRDDPAGSLTVNYEIVRIVLNQNGAPVEAPLDSASSARFRTSPEPDSTTGLRSVTLPADVSTANILITAVDNADKDGSLPLKIKLSPASTYTSGSPNEAEFTIFDDETTPLLIATSSLNVLRENLQEQSNIVFQRLGGDQSAPLQVNYRVGGTASGSDYIFSIGTTIGGNQNAAQGTISPNDNNLAEGDRTLTVTLDPPQNPADYLIGTPNSFTILIQDDDSNAPQANFSFDQMVQKGDAATVTVLLSSGPAHAARIPFSLQGSASPGEDFTVPSSNTLEIAQGIIQGEIQFQTLATTPISSVDEVLALDMTQPVNARLGQFTSHFIVLTQRNIAPVVNISVGQAGRQTRLISTTGGLVTLTATATDVNKNDTIAYDWRGSHQSLRQTAATQGDTYVFNPSGLSPGFYKVSVIATDDATTPQTNPVSTTAELQLQVIAGPPELSANDGDGDGANDSEEGFGDSDNDGIANYQDSNRLPPYVLQQQPLRNDRFVIRTRPGLTLALGDAAHASERGGAVVSIQDITRVGAGEGRPAVNTADNYVNAGGYYDFIISGPMISTNAQLPLPSVLSAPVVIPQAVAIPKDAVYREYTTLLGWHNFIINEKNLVYSAPDSSGTCPLPGDPIYVLGLTEGHMCVQLRIEDGGPNDTDTVANYRIEHLGGVTSLPDANASPVPRNPCGGLFCSGSSGSGGGFISWPTLLALALYVLMRNLNRRSAGLAMTGRAPLY